MNVPDLLNKAQKGFAEVKVGDKYKEAALTLLQKWLEDPLYKDYLPQVTHLIEAGHWDYLLDSFYQVIPFGTGGRRGEVGIGPNRINPFTIMASAQGHSQYLLKQYGDQAKERGVVLAYDVRVFTTNKYFNDKLPNPVRNLNCLDLAKAAAEVYAANGIKVYIFNDVRTTPELSFTIRYLHTVGGDMFSASHNPPEHNGKKVYDEFGGQLVPPEDENLVKEVTENVTEIKRQPYAEAEAAGLVSTIGTDVDDAYIEAVTNLSLSKERNLSIVYTPLHGCGHTSVKKVLEKAGFTVNVDPSTGNPSGKFENVTFNIPNPEVVQSFDSPLKYAKKLNADIILNSDPDADRLGIMVQKNGEWHFLNGNEIGVLLTSYVIGKKVKTLTGQGIIIKTLVTTNLITAIAKAANVKVIGDLLVGFKYVGQVMNELQKDGLIDNFLVGGEESHGYIAGNYSRDKDAAPAALWLAELAAELKQQGKTLVDYLDSLYAQYGYFKNYLTEIRLPGAEGMGQIQTIQDTLRSKPPQTIGSFAVDHVEDWLDRQPIVSETDRSSKNGLTLHLKPVTGTQSVRITIRPSGTEPKIKMYFELGGEPAGDKLNDSKERLNGLCAELEKAFMLFSYKAIGIDFPERGFLLFWQLPLQSKLKYFEIEPEIEAIKDLPAEKRQAKLDEVLAFLGSNPQEKVNRAFEAKHQQTIEAFLGLQ